MFGEIAQYISLDLILVFIFGFLLGFLLGKRQRRKFFCMAGNANLCSQRIDKKFKINPIFNKNASLDYKPMLLSFSSRKDKLTKIESIDEEIEKKLYSLGIFHFEQIANWTNKNSEWVESFLNLPNYVRKNSWIEQANILKTGHETDYSKALEENLLLDKTN